MSITEIIFKDEELFTDVGEGIMSWNGTGNYQPIINYFGEVLIQEDDKDYQGDSYILYKNYDLLIFGWGSCSGCDSLKACNSIEQLDSLIQQLKDSIIHLETKEKVKEYLLDDMKINKYYETEKAFQTFKNKVLQEVSK